MTWVGPNCTCAHRAQEQNANYLENNLLGQLRAAQKGQEINVWVMGRTKIRIRVGECARDERLALTADATNPPTSSSSAVLVNFETEIYVAPRPRGQEVPAEAPKVMAPPPVARASSGAGKGKAVAVKGATIRIVPPKVAAQWGVAELSADDAHTVGADKVAFVAPATLNKVRARLGQDQDGAPLLVTLRIKRADEEKKEDETPEAEPKEGENQEEEEPPLEAWLAAWDEMPTGCLALSGDLELEWKSWGVAM